MYDNHQNNQNNFRIFSLRKKQIFLLFLFGILAVFLVFFSAGSEEIKTTNLLQKTQKISSNPPLIFERQFSQFDSFTYLKNSSLCSEQILVNNQTQKFCHGITSNFTFLVVNTSSLDPDDNSTRIIDFYLYLNALTFNNETDAVEMGGANFTLINSSFFSQVEDYEADSTSFNSFVLKDRASNDTNLTGVVPLVMFQMHVNGSFFNVRKPVNISDPEMDHMMELIDEFSTKLCSDLYSPTSNRDYYENFGSSFVKPTFSVDNTSNSDEELIQVVKVIDKDHHLTMVFPESSTLKTTLRSSYNKTSGFLQSTYLHSMGVFEGQKVPELDPPSTDDYFNDQPRMTSNFSNTNYFQNSKIGAMSTESKTEMRMVGYQTNNRNLTFLLINFAVQTEFVPVNTSVALIRNETFLEEQRKMQVKVDKMLMNPTHLNKFHARQLFDKNSIEELRKDFEITYPVYQFDFFAWKARLIIDINIKPYQNQIESSVFLNIEGIVSTKIFERTDQVQLSQTIDKMIDFLYKAYAAIQQLENEVSEEMKDILGSKIVQLLEEIAKIVKFPFDIESLFKEGFEKLKEEINVDIEAFIKKIFDLFKTNEVNFGNPLQNITDYLQNRSDIDVLDFLGNFNNALQNLEKEKRGDFSKLYELAQNATELFPDVLDDLTYLQTLITKTFTDIPSKVNLHIQDNFKNTILSIATNITQTMDNSHTTLNKLLVNSGFSLGLKDNIDNLKSMFDTTFGQIKEWGTTFTDLFNSKLNLKEEIFEPIGNTARNMINNLNNQIDELKGYIENKTVKFDDLKVYEQLSSDFDNISLKYNEWRYKNFSTNFALPSMLDHTVNYSNTYLETYFQEYLKVEDFMHGYFNELKRNVDAIIFEVLRDVNEYNLNIGQLVKDINDLTPLFNRIIYDYQNMSIGKINNSIVNILPLLSEFTEKVKAEFNLKNDKVISCQEEVDAVNSFINAALPLWETFNKDVSDYLLKALDSLKESIVPMFNYKSVENATLNFFKINNLSENVELPFNSTEARLNVEIVFAQVKETVNATLESATYKQSEQNLVSSYLSKVEGLIVDSSNFTLIVKCSERKVNPPIPSKTFCSVFNLTLTEYNKIPATQEIIKDCSLEDKVTPELAIYKNSTLFEALSLSTLKISNETIFYMQTRLNSILQSIHFRTESIQNYSNNVFNEIDENLNGLIDLERDKVQEMLFDKNIEDLEKIFTVQVSATMKNLLQSYQNTINDIQSNLPKNTTIPLFVVNRIKNLYDEVSGDADIHVNWLKKEVKAKVNLTLDNMVLVHESNLGNIIRYLKTLTKSFIPFIINEKINQKVLTFETTLTKFYNNARILTQKILDFIDVGLNIDYDQFKNSYMSMLSNFKTVVDFAEINQEDVHKNITSSFEYNSYEKIKEIKFVTENFYYEIEGFSREYLDGNNKIFEKLTEINFDQFKNRFDYSIKRNKIKEVTIYQSTASNFESALGISIENLKTYLTNDFQIKDQIYIYVNELNNTINTQINAYKNELFNQLNEWALSIDNQTNVYLNNFNNSVTTQNLKNFKDFQNNIISKLSNSYSTILNQFEDIFYKNIFSLTSIIKNDFVNRTQTKLYAMRSALSKEMKISNKSIQIYEFLQKFEETFISTLTSLYDQIMSKIPYETESSLEYLLTTIKDNFDIAQKNLVEKLLNTQKSLQINNQIYLIAEQTRNHSDLVQVNLNPASNFEQIMFNFLKDKMANYSKLLSNVTIDIFNTSEVSNLTLFLDNSFQIYTINNIVDNVHSRLDKLFAFTSNEVRNLNITTEIPLLSDLIDYHYSSLMTPFKKVLYSESYISYFYNQTLENYQTISDVGFKSLTNVKLFLDSLISSTQVSSLHSLIMVTMKRKIYMDNVPKFLESKPEQLLGSIGDSLQQNLKKINNLINSKLDNITDLIQSNSAEGEMVIKSIKQIKSVNVTNYITWDLIEGQLLFNSSVITPLKAFYTASLIVKNTQLNTNFTALEEEIKKLIAGHIDQYPQQDQMYQIILDNINKLDSFAITLYQPSELFTSKIDESRKAFEGFVDWIIDAIIGCIDPLNKAIDGWIVDFAGIIKDSKIVPTIRDNILVPIEKFRQSILDSCINFMNKVTDRIIQIAESILNGESEALVPMQNLPALRNLERIDLQELEDIIDEFKSIYSKAISFVKSIPAIQMIMDIFKQFSDLFNGGISNIIQALVDKMKDFITIDPSKIQELKDKIQAAIVDIDQTVKREFVDVTNLIKETQDVIESFSFESIEGVLINAFNSCRDRLVNTLLADIAGKNWPAWSWDHGERYSYDIWLPIGPVPLDFAFAFDWRVWFNISTGLSGLDVYANFGLGASSGVEASAGVGLPLLQVAGYVKGVIARVQADFTLDYSISKFKAGIKLVFSGAFGEVSVGVGIKTMIQFSKLVCWLEKLVKKICDWFFLSWLCNWIFDWVQVCKWSTYLDWSAWIDFYNTKIFTVSEFNHVALMKTLG